MGDALRARSADGFVDRFRDSREHGLIRYRRQTSETTGRLDAAYSFFLSLSLCEERSDEVKGKKNNKKKKKKKDVKLYTHTVHAMEGKLALLDFTVHEEVSSVLVK